MTYQKLPEWPIIDPEIPPKGYLKVTEVTDPEVPDSVWHFFISGKHMIIVSRDWIQLDESDPGEYVAEQYEYPVASARWFVTTLRRFFLEPDNPRAVPRGAITIEEEVEGEMLGVTRGGSIRQHAKGYTGVFPG